MLSKRLLLSILVILLQVLTKGERNMKVIELPKRSPKMELFINSTKGYGNILMLNEFGRVVCRYYNGIPSLYPMLLDMTELAVKDVTYSMCYNLYSEVELKILAMRTSHLKVLKCRAGGTMATAKVFIYHHPSQVKLNTKVKSGTMKNGYSVICEPGDGYPIPEIRWHLLKGPPDAQKYFNITVGTGRLQIKSNAPSGSNWVFNCSATNVIPGSRGVYNQTFNFQVSRVVIENIWLKLVCMIGTIIIFIICIVLLRCSEIIPSINKRKFWFQKRVILCLFSIIVLLRIATIY